MTENDDWISVKDKMPDQPGLLRVKIDDGQEFDGFACRNGLGELTIQPWDKYVDCLLYTSPSPRDGLLSRMPSSA